MASIPRPAQPRASLPAATPAAPLRPVADLVPREGYLAREIERLGRAERLTGQEAFVLLQDGRARMGTVNDVVSLAKGEIDRILATEARPSGGGGRHTYERSVSRAPLKAASDQDLILAVRDGQAIRLSIGNILSTITAAEILALIKTVDGSGSGLDADLLDGETAAQLHAWANLTGVPDLQAHDADLDALAALSGTGIARRTGANTWSVGTSVSNSELAAMSAYTIKANMTGSSAAPLDKTPAEILDTYFSGTPGAMLGRGSASWLPIAPGTAGQSLIAQTGNLPTWGYPSAATITGTLATSAVPAFTGDVTNSAGSLATTVGRLNGVSLAGLATGLLKNTTVTGAPSVAVAGTDYQAPITAGTGLGFSGSTLNITDAELLAFAGATSAADRLFYFTGSGTGSLATFTAFGRSLVDDADASTARATLGLVIGTDVAAQSHVGSGGSAHANVVAGGAAGFMIGTDKTKLDGIATGATANSSDATLLNRANHTGTQSGTTVVVTSLSAAAAAADADVFMVNQGAANLKQTFTAVKTWIKSWIVKGDVGLGNVDNTSDATKNAATVALTNKDMTSGTNTFPTFNQNTTGSAAKLTTARNIDGQAFDGTAAITVIAPGTNAATSKATPVDADALPLVDSAASNTLKKLTWANLKATLKTYFDTLYQPLSADLTAAQAAWDTSFVPTVSSDGGAFTSFTTRTCSYRKVGKTVNATFRIATSAANLGSASGAVTVTLPFIVSAVRFAGVSYEAAWSGYSGAAILLNGTSNLRTVSAAGLSFVSPGQPLDLTITVCYETT